MPVDMEWVNVCCIMVKILVNDDDAASWCPWNQTAGRLIAFPPTGFMFDVHLKVSFFCRRRDSKSFDFPHQCNVSSYKSTASVICVAFTSIVAVEVKINSTLRTFPSSHLVPCLKQLMIIAEGAVRALYDCSVSSFFHSAASPLTLSFFGQTLGGAARAKTSAPSSPFVCWGCCVLWRPSNASPS